MNEKTNKKHNKIIVLGAGASGLMAAVICARQGRQVIIVEKNDKAGRKILATGNGKCNYTNLVQNPACYRSNEEGFAGKVLDKFNVKQTIEFFEELGIYPKDARGYLYPHSEQALSVVQVLEIECERLGIEIYYEHLIKKINHPFYTVVTDKKTFYGDKIILAMGGCASSNLGSDGSGYDIGRSFGHSVVKPLPALVQLKSPDKLGRYLAGLRLPAQITAYGNNEFLDKEKGEVLFTKYGISGIPVMQVSRHIAKALDQGDKTKLKLDFLPQLTMEESREILIKRKSHGGEKPCHEFLIGLVNNKLSPLLLKKAGIDENKKAKNLTSNEIDSLNKQVKEFILNVNGTLGFDHAQVTAGGIDSREIDPETMESRLQKNLYFAGEVIDVDGTCGGYNLQWAWSSGYLAGFWAGK